MLIIFTFKMLLFLKRFLISLICFFVPFCCLNNALSLANDNEKLLQEYFDNYASQYNDYPLVEYYTGPSLMIENNASIKGMVIETESIDSNSNINQSTKSVDINLDKTANAFGLTLGSALRVSDYVFFYTEGNISNFSSSFKSDEDFSRVFNEYSILKFNFSIGSGIRFSVKKIFFDLILGVDTALSKSKLNIDSSSNDSYYIFSTIPRSRVVNNSLSSSKTVLFFDQLSLLKDGYYEQWGSMFQNLALRGGVAFGFQFTDKMSLRFLLSSEKNLMDYKMLQSSFSFVKKTDINDNSGYWQVSDKGVVNIIKKDSTAITYNSPNIYMSLLFSISI